MKSLYTVECLNCVEGKMRLGTKTSSLSYSVKLMIPMTTMSNKIKSKINQHSNTKKYIDIFHVGFLISKIFNFVEKLEVVCPFTYIKMSSTIRVLFPYSVHINTEKMKFFTIH